MKILIAGGGTGGHVYPGIAVANKIKEVYPNIDIEFVGKQSAIEGRVVPKEGYHLHHLNVYAYERGYSHAEKAKVLWYMMLGVFRSISLLKHVKPDLVIGTGGYVCGPVVLAAKWKRLPTLIMEQNVIPGFTIHTLSRFATVVCTSFEQSKQYMKHPERCVFTGNPVREEFDLWDRTSARRELQLSDDDRLVLCFGGSLGSRSLNKAILGLIRKAMSEPDFHVCHVTGEHIYREFLSQLEEAGLQIDTYQNISVLAYADNMPLLIHAADLVISRSGATSIAELNYVGVPAIYVPFPHAANDHQTKNAVVTANAGASVVIPDEQMDEKILSEKVGWLFSDPRWLHAMAEASERLGKKNASDLILQEVVKLLGKK
jgi:UDP-N-acetylglucosamine--N-acetylmuramyl-(pentapeptide) pyrophosphoryl-undecaprenol N-acetylglucosamine transferase